MEIEKLNDSNKDEWNTFCSNSNDAWFRHTTYWMDYIISCRFDSDSVNHSFLIRQNKEIVAVVPLISQYCYLNRDLNEFANYDTPVPYWALKNDNKNINKHEIINFIQMEIEKIANEHNIKKGSFFIDPLMANNWLDDFEYYNLLKYGYDYKMKTTNILDVSFPEELILSGMRKGHKSDIKRALKDKDIRIDYVDNSCNNIYESLLEFKKIHAIDAGRQTRTDDSWACQLSWLLNGYAVLVLAWSNSLNKYVSGAFINMYKNSAYYGSFATIDAELNNAILGHLIQWYGIKYMKSKNIKRYETGWNYYMSSFEHGYDEKLIQISKFKGGFGGKEVIFLEYIIPPPPPI
jgi:lipid II:glycine glycyltransferase (peptidoglycan interpeptide bridge formation enzyme)